eukprot:gene2625-3017_t
MVQTPVNLYFNTNNENTLNTLRKCPSLYIEPANKSKPVGSRVVKTSVDSTPSVANDAVYETSYMLSYGHFHILYATYHRTPFNLSSTRETLVAEDGGTVSLDWFQFGNTYRADTPTILILHGLTGGSHEVYVQSFAKHAYTNSGYRTVVFNYRGCAQNPVTADKTYCASFTDDLKMVIKHIIKSLPQAKLFAIGFSLGSAILTKYLSQVGDLSPFIAHASCSNPMDMNKSAMHLESNFINSIYTKSLANNLKVLFDKWGNRLDNLATKETISKAVTIRDVDEMVTCKVFGYDNAAHYYLDASSSHLIETHGEDI